MTFSRRPIWPSATGARRRRFRCRGCMPFPWSPSRYWPRAAPGGRGRDERGGRTRRRNGRRAAAARRTPPEPRAAALHEGRADLVAEHARELLDLATRSGFRLQIVDTLELLVAADRANDDLDSTSQLTQAQRATSARRWPIASRCSRELESTGALAGLQRSDDHNPKNQGMCRPEMLRATTSRWISDVPSKIV